MSEYQIKQKLKKYFDLLEPIKFKNNATTE